MRARTSHVLSLKLLLPTLLYCVEESWALPGVDLLRFLDLFHCVEESWALLVLTNLSSSSS